MSNYIKSKSEALKFFKDNCNNYPFWKIYELGKRSPIYTNIIEGDESKTIKAFEDALRDLYPEKIYTVQQFRNLAHRKGGQKFIVPNMEFSFEFQRSEVPVVVPVMNGANAPVQHQMPVIAPYAVDTRQHINLNDHVALISAKAKAESDCQYYMSVISDQKKIITDLERENEELRNEVEELEDELDGIEEEEEEKEKAKIAGDENESIEKAIASVIKENGAVILENLMSKGVKPETKESEISGEEEEQEQEKDEQKVNGMPENIHLMDMTFAQLDDAMLAINAKWKQHLCKLILIGRQKPATFKMFMKKLEDF